VSPRKRFQVEIEVAYNGHAEASLTVKKDGQIFGSLTPKDGSISWRKARKRHSVKMSWERFSQLMEK